MEPQALLDQPVEGPALNGSILFPVPRLHQAEADDLGDLGGQDGVFVDHRQDAIDQHLLRRCDS